MLIHPVIKLRGLGGVRAQWRVVATAFFVANDFAAMGAIAAVEDAGLRIPEDISVIGYDGISLGALRNINLTSIAQPLSDLGRRAAQRLLHRIQFPTTQAHHDRVASQLVTRGTTAPAPR